MHLARLLRELTIICLGWADDLARELVTAGIPPDGRITTVASSPHLIPLPPMWREERDIAELVASRCRLFATWADQRAIASATSANPLLLGIAHGFRGFATACEEFM